MSYLYTEEDTKATRPKMLYLICRFSYTKTHVTGSIFNRIVEMKFLVNQMFKWVEFDRIPAS